MKLLDSLRQALRTKPCSYRTALCYVRGTVPHLRFQKRGVERGHRAIAEAAPATRTRLVGAGNGLRENPAPRHREEAAYGAALLAAVGCGAYPNLAGPGQLIPYAEG
jgi:hypothetical protein